MKGKRKELVDTATASSRTSKSHCADFTRGNLLPFSRLGSSDPSVPAFPSPGLHRLSVRRPKIGSAIRREFAVRLDRPFSPGGSVPSRPAI